LLVAKDVPDGPAVGTPESLTFREGTMRLRSKDERLNPKNLPGLASLESATVDKLLQAGRLVHIAEGWTPIRANEPADEAYLVLEGCVEVVAGEETLADVCRGEFFGEMGLVDHALRNARITVVEPVLALAWPRQDFQQLREDVPDFDALVRETAARRAQENEQRA
jgi:CRP/FNR family cyclic AMP-dependent transcriptional regulator